MKKPSTDPSREDIARMEAAQAKRARRAERNQRTHEVHHLDLPWEPATPEQRDGRAVRHHFDVVTPYTGPVTMSVGDQTRDMRAEFAPRVWHVSLEADVTGEQALAMLDVMPDPAAMAAVFGETSLSARRPGRALQELRKAGLATYDKGRRQWNRT